MAYNKSKHIEAAQRYLSQGKLPQAIAEYQQILKHEPKDQVTLMTLGDLFVRQGETFQALEYFERLGQIFQNDGFTTKAIAIYKKIAKLAPEEVRPLERLAELYVQQGVLSEARPLYLRLAELQLKAGRQQHAATLLRKLLDAEPDNLRVETRLGELLVAMGQKKEAIEIFHRAAQYVLERGEHAEAVRLTDHVLKIDARHAPTLVLKARALSGTGKRAEALSLLESAAAHDPSAAAITPLLDHYVEGGQLEKAATLAEKLYALDPKNYLLAHRVAFALLDSGDPERAQHLLGLIRTTMTDAGDHENLAHTLSLLAERRAGQIEPLEWLVDLYGKASDSFRLPDALAQLAQGLEASGDTARALETYEKLLDRNREDEATRRHCVRLRANLGIKATSPDAAPPVAAKPAEPPPAPAPPPESKLDEETQRYVTQALTEVDLFSSYGLSQKAIDLLETVLQRAPKHSAALERLLDFYVGAGNDRRTAELATVLEQIAVERNDRAGAERYADMRHRFQRAAGISPGEATAAAEKTSAAPQEFAVPTIEAELAEPLPEAPGGPVATEKPSAPAPPASIVHEVDLSDEWAALSVQLDEVMKTEIADATESTAAAETQAPLAVPVPEPTPEPIEESPVTLDESSLEIPAFDLVPQPPVSADGAQEEASLADSFLKKLANELEDATLSLDVPDPVQQSSGPPKAPPVVAATGPALIPAPPVASGTPPQAASGEASGPLGDLFEEFRNELGEAAKDEVDLETHYNLGIAYREMGLLEEAISEFQRVAKEHNQGSAFRYGMQCCTLLGLAFMEKGQPAIAAMWYERALQSPKLDAESILALRYDLGVAQELAGETAAAFKSFSEVYAMNIDYRDVAERVALLGKAR
jgi:tetratricopeptide (TPR) repeat protein